MNALGIYLLGCLGFVGLAMIEFAIVVLWRRIPRPMKNAVNKKVLQRGISFDLESDKPYTTIFGYPSHYVLDFIAFWCFLLLFLIFNITYWSHYSGI